MGIFSNEKLLSVVASFMESQNNPALELALLQAARTELATMRSLTELDDVAHVSIVLAMRLSRSWISGLCRFRHPIDDGHFLLSPDTVTDMNDIEIELERLYNLFAQRLQALPNEHILHAIWKS